MAQKGEGETKRSLEKSCFRLRRDAEFVSGKQEVRKVIKEKIPITHFLFGLPLDRSQISKTRTDILGLRR